MKLAAPALIVCGSVSPKTCTAGHDVIVGSDPRADLRVPHSIVSRAHLLLRFERGVWRAIDTTSRYGTFVDQRRVRSIEICTTRRVNLGAPDGPSLTFDVTEAGATGLPPRIVPMRAKEGPARGSSNPPGIMPVEFDPPRSCTTIGRAIGNDIVVDDGLASRNNAFLVETPRGIEVRDCRSTNGTFVNGVRVGSAVLSEDDVVTVGNTDLVFADGTLINRRRVAPRDEFGRLPTFARRRSAF